MRCLVLGKSPTNNVPIPVNTTRGTVVCMKAGVATNIFKFISWWALVQQQRLLLHTMFYLQCDRRGTTRMVIMGFKMRQAKASRQAGKSVSDDEDDDDDDDQHSFTNSWVIWYGYVQNCLSIVQLRGANLFWIGRGFGWLFKLLFTITFNVI